MKTIKKTFILGGQQVTLETGRIARQATGSVLIQMGDTVLLATVVASKSSEEGRDFFPLTVDYREKSYAVGRIPGGYFKREGRPTEKETLISRLIDRPLRPLFANGFTNEVQVVVTALSIDPNVPTDVPAIIASAAAVGLAGLPFNGPLAASRVGYLNAQYCLNPSWEQLQSSALNLVVAGTRNAVLMVESEAQELSEEVMLGAVLFGHEQMQPAIRAIQELVDENNGTPWEWTPPADNRELAQSIETQVGEALAAAYRIREKQERQQRIAKIRDELVTKLSPGTSPETEPAAAKVATLFHDLEAKIVRNQILNGEPRIDGRDTETVRPITIEIGVLPRTHGSAVFTRGETQALVVCTLGTDRDAQIVDDLEGEFREHFMLHYNFPPYSVGEIGFMTGPKRREIGHGRLAKRGVQAIMPKAGEFPYVVRVVSEITESNGSSSMASICGTSLALMDAGVPVKSAVAGIAMGLIKEEDKYAVLTDILGDEDHLGDMDFKVAGTRGGVTALQMDIKIQGITKEIMEEALAQARDGRMHILDIMDGAIKGPRTEVSEHAPRITTFKINPDKIREVIGKGGATIRELTESTNTTIDISDDGVVKVAALTQRDGEEAVRRIEEIVEEVEIGKTYEGKVVKLMDFGAFVAVLPSKQGLVHISQISDQRIEDIHSVLHEGQLVRVKVVDIDRQGRVRLSMKDIEQPSSVSN